MTSSSSLIDMLVDDIRPVSPREAGRQVTAALIAGSIVALAGVVALFGIQPGLGTFAHAAPLMVKGTYALSLAAIAISLTFVLAQPGAPVEKGWRWVAAPVAALTTLALFQVARTPSAEWAGMLMGDSWAQCPWRIAALSIPVFAGLCVAIRSQAPTDLRAAGAAAGLLSGTVAATIYALACTESSAAFILVWYSFGIALATGIGALLGPKILRW